MERAEWVRSHVTENALMLPCNTTFDIFQSQVPGGRQGEVEHPKEAVNPKAVNLPDMYTSATCVRIGSLFLLKELS